MVGLGTQIIASKDWESKHSQHLIGDMAFYRASAERWKDSQPWFNTGGALLGIAKDHPTLLYNS